MLNKKFFDDLSAKIGDTIANSPIKDMEQNIKAILSSAFNRMDLVTRDEFDIQQQVLLKTREKLAQLEAKITALEGLIVNNRPCIEGSSSEPDNIDNNQPQA